MLPASTNLPTKGVLIDVVNPVELAIRKTLRSAPITRGGDYDIPFAGIFSSKDS